MFTYIYIYIYGYRLESTTVKYKPFHDGLCVFADVYVCTCTGVCIYIYKSVWVHMPACIQALSYIIGGVIVYHRKPYYMQ